MTEKKKATEREQRELAAKIEHEEMAALLEILEEMEDQEKAVEFLKSFNQKNSRFGEVIQKRATITHEEYEKAYSELREIVTEILKQGNPLLADQE